VDMLDLREINHNKKFIMNTWEYYRDFSKKIGDTVKIVGLGIIGTCFTILTTNNDIFSLIINHHRFLISLTLMLAILGILFDYLHTLIGYIDARYIYVNNLKLGGGRKFCIYMGLIFFWMKQIFIFVSASILIYLLYISF